MKAFFDAIRPAFKGKLTQRQVEGMEALLKAGKGLPRHWMAFILANVHRETGGGMYPIKETVMPHHKNQEPTDAEVIRRLDSAFAKGNLPWVKTPYWRTGEFGRGQIQVTHAANRLKFGVTDRDDLLKLDVSARVAVEGMVKGLFTGKKLGDYVFPDALALPPERHPRRIVNGQDGSDTIVTRWHQHFAAALEAAGWPEDGAARPRPDMAQVEAPAVSKPQSPKVSPLAALVAAIATLVAALFAGIFGG